MGISSSSRIHRITPCWKIQDFGLNPQIIILIPLFQKDPGKVFGFSLMGYPTLACHAYMAALPLSRLACHSSQPIFRWSRYMRRYVQLPSRYADFLAQTTIFRHSRQWPADSGSPSTSNLKGWFICMHFIGQTNLASHPRSQFIQAKAIFRFSAHPETLFDLVRNLTPNSHHVAKTPMARSVRRRCIRYWWTMWHWGRYNFSHRSMFLVFTSHVTPRFQKSPYPPTW